MLKLMTWVMISIFVFSPMLLVGCNESENTKKVVSQEKEADQFYAGDNVRVILFTPAGEKKYEGTLVRWWDKGLTIKVGRNLVGLGSENYEVEKQ